jgi:hypothetical protein
MPYEKQQSKLGAICTVNARGFEAKPLFKGGELC